MAKALGVRELIAERERQQQIIEQAKVARVSIDLLNRLIAQYGINEDEEEALVEEYEFVCEFCDRGFASQQGVSSHITRSHKDVEK
jgi:hypothetical protein